MKRRLYYYPLAIVILAVLLGLFGWLTESSSIRWVAPAFGLALIAVGLGVNSLIIALHTEKRATEIGAILARIEGLAEEMPLWVRPENTYDPLPPPPPTVWEETTILAAGLAPENDSQLVQALIRVNPVLAGRCLHDGQAKVDQATRQGVIEALLDTIARPEVALRVRIAAGDVLGYLDDPRLGELVTVPAGAFLMGEDQEQHKLFLPDYQIGKYPLTNAEYRSFIEAGGYQQQRWWTEAGWVKKENPSGDWARLRGEAGKTWTEPRYWRDNRFSKLNQPVVGISWYEAVAYCRWLSAETGRQHRLPTEAEWEKAARGVDGHTYPWGNRFEAGRLNVEGGEQTVRATTPVGIYSTGISPFGLFDCAGNVGEWCATERGKSYPYDVTEDEWAADYLDRTDIRVLRGGSWYHIRLFARCAGRYGDNYIRRSYFGFRVLVSPSS